MYNHVTIEFPNTRAKPKRVRSFSLAQKRYAHEIATIRFRDWDVKYSQLMPGDPVKCQLIGKGAKKEFVGYVHDVSTELKPGARFVNLTVIGASYQMKQAKQRVFEDATASAVAKIIAEEHGFQCHVDNHPRIYPQIVQAGVTDLQLLSRLAKQCGYTLRVENTTLHFKKMTKEFEENRENAPHFIMREANDPKGSTLYEFNLLVGESNLFGDAYKSAVQFGGVNPNNLSGFTAANVKQPTTLRTHFTNEFFDSFATDTVIPDQKTALSEAEAADERNRFAYRANVKVIGTADLHPDMPIYLEGIGNEYSGYWIVLASTHQVVESNPNIFTYVTYLTVGADSIGTANVFKGKKVSRPNTVRVRKLTPGVKNVVKVGSSKYRAPNNRIQGINRDNEFSSSGQSGTWQSTEPGVV